jgi:Mn2+/Fe2+ NRAMP family transporter
MTAPDPYAYSRDDVQEPPRGLAGALRRVGPGLLLTASIVGTGELIATTRLGAEVGYVMLWAILLSCVAKTIVQAVWGRYTIVTGETALAAVNHVPGPRARGVNWIVWAWGLMILLSLSLIGAMYAGVAQVLALLLPAVPVDAWVVALALVTLLVLLLGSYRHVEQAAIWMVAIFTCMTVLAAGVLTGQPEYFSWAQVASGLEFGLPEKGLVIAVAVFGITGVNTAELFSYPYWCVEKGYARFTGPREDSVAWRLRARGWIRVMHCDVVVSLIIYTAATVAFYLLGAGVLHTLGEVPSGSETISVLSRMYTQTMGGFGLYVSYAGAVFALYSTVFAGTAANSRIYADLVRLAGGFDADDYAARLRWQRAFVVFLTLVPLAVYFAIGELVLMVKIGGVVFALMLPVAGLAVVYLRHRRLPAELAPAPWATLALWAVTGITALAMTALVLIQLGLVTA